MKSRLLFIDDESEILEAYKSLFTKNTNNDLDDLLSSLNIGNDEGNDQNNEDFAYEVVTASQGLDGVKEVQKSVELDKSFQVAFIDMRMPPGISGAETAKRIRQIDPDIEIVFVTAYSDIDLNKIIHDIGAPDKLLYLKKPFDSQEVKQLALNLSEKYFNGKVKDRFLANVTHELKTPLASILGFSQLLQDEPTEEEKDEYIEIIYKNANLMKSLIDSLLASVTDKKKQSHKERISLNATIDFVMTMLAPEAEKKKLKIISEINGEQYITGDINKITQCFINLIGNAIKFTDVGEIKVHSYFDNENIKVEIQDTGIGIPQEFKTEIFKRFVRVEDEHHNIPGFGLGLSIVKAILDDHDCDIELDSELNKGSKFTLTFNKVA